MLSILSVTFSSTYSSFMEVFWCSISSLLCVSSLVLKESIVAEIGRFLGEDVLF